MYQRRKVSFSFVLCNKYQINLFVFRFFAFCVADHWHPCLWNWKKRRNHCYIGKICLSLWWSKKFWTQILKILNDRGSTYCDYKATAHPAAAGRNVVLFSLTSQSKWTKMAGYQCCVISNYLIPASGILIQTINFTLCKDKFWSQMETCNLSSEDPKQGSTVLHG